MISSNKVNINIEIKYDVFYVNDILNLITIEEFNT